jgi:hypothetical protein
MYIHSKLEASSLLHSKFWKTPLRCPRAVQRATPTTEKLRRQPTKPEIISNFEGCFQVHLGPRRINGNYSHCVLSDVTCPMLTRTQFDPTTEVATPSRLYLLLAKMALIKSTGQRTMRACYRQLCNALTDHVPLFSIHVAQSLCGRLLFTAGFAAGLAFAALLDEVDLSICACPCVAPDGCCMSHSRPNSWFQLLALL